MYADDILILSPTVNGLQLLLNKCTDLFNNKLLEFNVNKSSCFIVGPASGFSIQPLKLQGLDIQWTDNLTYLGINFEFGRKLKIEIESRRRKFYASSNAILYKTNRFDELARLSLVSAHCLPVLFIFYSCIKYQS